MSQSNSTVQERVFESEVTGRAHLGLAGDCLCHDSFSARGLIYHE